MDINNNLIFAVDFDGTLSLGQWPDTGEPNEQLIEFLIMEKEKGSRVILWTSRTGKLLIDALEYCEGYGLYFDAVNENLPEIVKLYGADSRKISADVYIDDKSINPYPEELQEHIREVTYRQAMNRTEKLREQIREKQKGG